MFFLQATFEAWMLSLTTKILSEKLVQDIELMALSEQATLPIKVPRTSQAAMPNQVLFHYFKTGLAIS